MSSLAFDKQGRPFGFHRRTKKLLVRLFRNPSARGTCSQVMNADGQPLFVDPETDYNEFRRAVGHVPGLYRLDQCDENGVELEDAQAAYVAIDVARNASPHAGESGASEVNPLVVIEHLVAVQADVMKTMSAQHASVMAATAEILRAPYRPPLPMPATVLRNASSDDEEDDDDIDPQPIVIESPWTRVVERVLPTLEIIGGFGVALLQRKFFPNSAIAVPGAAATSTQPGHVPTPRMVRKPTTSAPSSSSTTPAFDRTSDVPEANAEHRVDIDRTPTPPDSTAPLPAPIAMTIADQYARLFAIREQLTPEEREYAEPVIASMGPEKRAAWLAALSAMSLDEATASIRTTITQLRAGKA